MGMGYGANFDVIIAEEDVKKICSREGAKLDSLINEYGSSWEDVAQASEYSNEIEGVDEKGNNVIWDAIEVVLKAFKERTGIGLDFHYHDSDSHGDRYDEVNGVYYSLNWNDCYQITPQYKQLREIGVDATMKYWVTYG